ncbi:MULTISPECIES: 6-hydroxymethylpterin diphosphokinase MptE-like protein [unclassified Mesobacillus]|uniref:motility associated factor glycosyltransferase family protein n=1 Tax=unclassified Mesobacillus TaxID=2675270 RepID=UPI002040D90C|nr:MULTISPECIES: 6-hydroxymethylpterin diphosphokinase MptE-like protein [unclassified Mesobacillus]MCM3124126.1 DUF115 domain-containing protein [Mesobacillus sp. MER 33]MCM3233975.1 DUF115 domain-containing protein [Mesobacillus sp. MER 48]
MILIENRNFLRKNNPALLEKISNIEESGKESLVTVEAGKNNAKTIKVNVDGKIQYIHSKYDPETEAKRLVDKLGGMEKYNQVLFFGIGLGYQIDEFLKKYPSMKFSFYEPNLEVFLQYLSHRKLTDLPVKQIQSIFVSASEEQIRHGINILDDSIGSSTYIFTLPLYESIYSNELKILMDAFKERLKDKRSNIATNVSFQQRWSINSIKNFPTVLQTPNILHDIDKSFFKGKPVILVAAGPSLSDEFENLRYIKENGLAYIFSVGSAINALIEHGIFPDAACSYDPGINNQMVIKKIKDLEISNIPLVFGSSVGYETLYDYPGKLVHMITSQDTITPFLLDTTQDIDIVLDAPSIAVVTFQMLTKLGCNLIILAGQNLSYKNNLRYAKGIKYDHVGNELTYEETKDLIRVKSVDGNDVFADQTFVLMRKQLEMYINNSKEVEVINTTQGGAHIEGTTFMDLLEVISSKLQKKDIVSADWCESYNSYNNDYVKKQLDTMASSMGRFEKDLKTAVKDLKEINFFLQQNNISKLEQKFAKFDKEFGNIQQNLFFQSFIGPMVRIQNKLLSEESKSVRYEINPLKKGKKVVYLFGSFLAECESCYQVVVPLFKELQDEILTMKV